jgi:MFS family permease
MPPIHSLATELRALPRAFWVIFAGTFINRFGSFVYPFLTILLHRRGFDYGSIGMAVGSFGFGGLISSLAGGWFADRFGRRNSIVLGTFANAIFVFAIYWAHALPAIMILTVLAGFTGGFFHPASSALIADIVPAHLQLRAYAAQRVAANAGFAFGTATGGFLVTHSTFWLFAGDALTTASYGVLALLMLPHGLRHTSEQARWGEAFGRLRRDGKFWALAAAQFCAALVFTQFASSYSLEVIGRGLVIDIAGFRLAAEQVFGVLIGWNGVLVTFCELPLTRTTQRFEPRRVMCLGYVLLGGGFALNAAPGGFATLFAAMTLFTLGEMVAIPMSSTWIARIAPETMRGRYIGALQMAWAAANVVGPQIGLRLYGLKPMALWFGCGALGLVAAATLWRFGDPAPSEAPVAVEPAV